jgi:hypothetical protein
MMETNIINKNMRTRKVCPHCISPVAVGGMNNVTILETFEVTRLVVVDEGGSSAFTIIARSLSTFLGSTRFDIIIDE